MPSEHRIYVTVTPGLLAAVDKWRVERAVEAGDNLPESRSAVVRLALEKFLRDSAG